MRKKLSIIIPCYNEEKYIEKVLSRVNSIKLENDMEKEVVIVDDGSTDNTFASISAYKLAHPDFNIKTLQHPKNYGKGAAVKNALKLITGDLVIIQDADLEYDPKDYNKMILPVLNENADVVLGSRFIGSEVIKGPFFLHVFVNKVYTSLVNILTKRNFTDIHTCYKLFKSEIILNIDFKEKRFGVDPEIISKLGKRKEIKICEVGISYKGRSFSEGKKISWSDGIRAFYCIIKYNFFEK